MSRLPSSGVRYAAREAAHRSRTRVPAVSTGRIPARGCGSRGRSWGSRPSVATGMPTPPVTKCSPWSRSRRYTDALCILVGTCQGKCCSKTSCRLVSRPPYLRTNPGDVLPGDLRAVRRSRIGCNPCSLGLLSRIALLRVVLCSGVPCSLLCCGVCERKHLCTLSSGLGAEWAGVQRKRVTRGRRPAARIRALRRRKSEHFAEE